MAEQPWFKFFRTTARLILVLPRQKAGRVIQAALQYYIDGTEPEPMSGPEDMAFSALREDIDGSAETYREMCRRNQTNRTKGKTDGGRPLVDESSTSRRRVVPKAEAEEEAEAESEVEKEGKEEAVRFPAASAAAYLSPAERDAIAQRIMFGTATAEDFEAYRGYFHQGER